MMKTSKVDLAVKLYWVAQNDPKLENEEKLYDAVRQLSPKKFKQYIAQTVTTQ